MSGEGGHEVPQNQGSRTRERGNLPSGSTRRVEQSSTAPIVHAYRRMRPYFRQVLAYDEGASWIEGEGIRLESGNFLRTVQAAKKYLEHCDNSEPGEW
jgi:hypothetical protein